MIWQNYSAVAGNRIEKPLYEFFFYTWHITGGDKNPLVARRRQPCVNSTQRTSARINIPHFGNFGYIKFTAAVAYDNDFVEHIPPSAQRTFQKQLIIYPQQTFVAAEPTAPAASQDNRGGLQYTPPLRPAIMNGSRQAISKASSVSLSVSSKQLITGRDR